MTEETKVGHNSGVVESRKLKEYVDRLENMSAQIVDIRADMKDIMAEAKSNGFDAKALRRLLAWRKLEAEEREERTYMDELYQGVFS